MAWIAPVVGAAASLLGGAMNSGSQSSTNQTNERIANEEMAWQTTMSNTAEQRHVEDLQAAGLNPALAYGTPAPVPGQAPLPSVQSTNPGQGVIAAGQQIGQVQMQAAQTEAAKASASQSTANARNANANAAVTEAQAPYAGSTAEQNLKNMQASEQELDARINNLVEQRPGFRAESAQAWQTLNQQKDLWPIVQQLQSINLQRQQLGMQRVENDASWQKAHPGLSGWIQSGTGGATAEVGVGGAALGGLGAKAAGWALGF